MERNPNAPILLVEGDAIDESRAVKAYTETGCSNRLLVARTAENALTLLKACAKGVRFGLVLLDMHVPRFGSGHLLSLIRRDPEIADVPVVVMTPATATEREREVECRLANDCLPRPATHAEFITKLQEVVRSFVRGGGRPCRGAPDAVGNRGT